MCGFLGSINFNTSKIEFQNSLNLITHRGKDQTKSIEIKESNIFLGFNRLSILDLSNKAMQPMVDNSQKVYLLYNGEIYNFKELKEELETHNIIFKTECDAEVLLNSYLKWGLDITLKKIKGMFSFFILDTRISKSYLCVDKIGIKPMYYLYFENKILFSSEIKSIINLIKSAKIEKIQVKKEIFFGKQFDENTIFSNIKQLPSGHHIEFNYKKNELHLNTYFNLNSFVNADKFNEIARDKNIVETYDKTMSDIIKKHCQSDVLVGIMYSGGIDSSLIAVKASQYLDYKVPLFFFDSKDKSHYEYAKLINSTNKFELVKVEEKNIDYVRQIVDLAYYFERPNKIEALPLMYLSNVASQRGIKVLLSGDGADELLGGYEFHTNFFQKKKFYENKIFLNILKLLKIKSKFNIFNFQENDPIKEDYLFQPLRFESLEIFFNILLERPNRIQEWKDSLQAYNFINDKVENSVLSFILDTFKSRIDLYNHRADRIGMSNGVEIRVPYLYDDFVSLALNTQLKYKIRNNFLMKPKEKYILKILAKKNNVPNQIINRKKVGTEFNISKLLDKIVKKIEFKFCAEFLNIRSDDIKKNLSTSFDHQKYTYQFSLIIIELTCRIFVDKIPRDELYTYLNKILKD